MFPYYLGEEYYKNSNLSKYAVPDDYHKICGVYLEKAVSHLKEKYTEYSFEYFCDNSPINEVYAACLSGLGVKGENSLLINKTYGSFCFIGEIITDLDIPVEEKETETNTNTGESNVINNTTINATCKNCTKPSQKAVAKSPAG